MRLIACLAAWPAWTAENDPILYLKNYTAGQDRTNLTVVENRVRAATADPGRAADMELRLLSVLQSDASYETKQFVCRQLRLVGSGISVPVLGFLLNDPKLAHMARQALETMPSFSAGTTLRQALQTARGDLLIGIINSLGQRGEPASVPALLAHLNGRDVAVVQAAVSALGRIGGEPALDALLAVARHYEPALAEGVLVTVTPSEDVRRRFDVALLFDALLASADTILKAGGVDRASEIYARVYEAAPVPRPQRIAALTGLTHAAPGRAAPLILRLLRGGDPTLQATAADLVRQLPAPSAAPIVALLDTLPAAQQALVIEALAERPNPALLFPLLKASLSSDPRVRVAALRSLAAQDGNRETVQLLLGVASGETAESAIARQSLGRLRGPEVDADLIALLDHSRVAMRAEAARCLALRGTRNAIPRLVKALGDANAQVRFATLESLGQLGEKEQLHVLLTHLANAGAPAEQAVAAKAILAIAGSVATISPREARDAIDRVLATVTAESIQADAKQALNLLEMER